MNESSKPTCDQPSSQSDRSSKEQESTFEWKNDPFAQRQGHHLRWKNVCMSVELPKSTPFQTDHANTTTKIILDNVWGEVPEGQTTAILGPSGSGKTSLLNILSGRVATTNHDSNQSSSHNDHCDTKQSKRKAGLRVQADVRLNNYAVDPSNIKVRQSIAFVAQDDSLQATATVREAILFSAKLRLSKSNTDQDLNALVDRMMTELGLLHCADTLIGGPLLKGVSGGERKRTSIGVELVTQPPLVCLDEPTSGLDSYSALQLSKVLKKVAAAGSSVLFTIHQPSSEIFKTFDHVLLLKEGRILFSGGHSQLSDYFDQRGYPVPEEYNPADWVMQVAQSYTAKELQAAGFYPSPPREWDEPPVVDSSGHDGLGNTLRTLGENRPSARMGWLGQTKLLFAREVTNFRRNRHAIKTRTAMTIAISLFIGILFYDVAQTSCSEFINIQSTFGALLMSLLANVFSTTLPSLLVFPQERPVFLREYSTNHYGVLAYFMSRLATEFIVTGVQVTVSTLITYFMVGFDGLFGPFYLVIYLLAMASTALGVLLGSSSEHPSTAMEMLPGVIMPQILFSGFFVPPELIPNWLAWVRYICPLTYAVRIALVNEFDGGRCDGQPPNYPQRVLSNVEADPDEMWWYWLVLAGMFVVLRVLALMNLRRKANKFY